MRIEARLPDAEALRRVILAPFEGAGVRVRFVDRSAGRPAQAELSQRCFQSLHEATGGSPLGAWAHWLCRLEGDGDAGRLDAPPIEVPELDFVRDLDHAGLLTLASLLQHGGLTASEHAELFLSPVAASARLLDRLAATGLIDREGGHGPEERYDANPVVAWRLAEILRAVNVLP